MIEKFDEHFVPKRNVIHERAKFHQRKQQQGESAEVFIRSLFDLAKYCDFGNSKDKQIWDRIVIGAQDKQISRRLQAKADLDLAMAIQMTRQSELIKSQISDQRRRRGQVPRRKNGEEFWRTIEQKRKSANMTVVFAEGAIVNIAKRMSAQQEANNAEIATKRTFCCCLP